MAAGGGIDALSQFKLFTVFGPLGASVRFTQSNLYMVAAGILTVWLLILGTRARAVVPGRLQVLAEYAYESVLGMCLDTIGEEGRRYFPFIFTLFYFILLGNLFGLLPYGFAYTSHIVVTVALALLVVIFSTIEGLRIHKLHFFSYFYPQGVPVALAPLIVPIEIVSYLSRIVSLSVRLFANMVAGHVMLELFAGFAVMMGAAGVLGLFAAIGPMALDVVLIGFELLVAFLQAYVFAILACIYLHDAVHLH